MRRVNYAIEKLKADLKHEMVQIKLLRGKVNPTMVEGLIKSAKELREGIRVLTEYSKRNKSNDNV